MIRFLCQDCAHRISVLDEFAGRTGSCPECGSVVVIPNGQAPIHTDIQLDFIEPPAATGDGDEPGELFEQEYFNDLGLKPIAFANREAGKRQKPWYIDIFLYPVSTTGVINYLMLVLFPPIFSLIAMILFSGSFSIVGVFIGFFFVMFNFIIRAYFFWYMAECVSDSCTGGTRAPSVFTVAGDDIWAVIGFYCSLFMCFVLCFAPAPISLIGNFNFGLQYWALTAIGCMVFPILLLSIIVIDSSSAWNPVTLIVAVVKLMPQYLILPVSLFTGILLMHSLVIWLFGKDSTFFAMLPVLKPIIVAIGVYFSYIAAHLLGRFYWKNADRLDW